MSFSDETLQNQDYWLEEYGTHLKQCGRCCSAERAPNKAVRVTVRCPKGNQIVRNVQMGAAPPPLAAGIV